MAMRSEGNGQKEDGKQHFPLKSLLASSIVLAAATALLSGLLLVLSGPSERLEKLEEWEYASDDGRRTNGLNVDDWKQADKEHPVYKEEADTYLFLRGTLPAEMSGRVYIYGSDSSYKITVDGETVYDILEEGPVLTASQAVSFLVERSEADREVEITAYVPFSDSVEVYSSDSSAPFPSFLVLPNLDIVLAAGFALLAAVRLVWSYVGKRGKHGRTEILLPLLLLIMAAAVLMGRIGGAIPSFRMKITCILLVYTGCMVRYLFKMSGWCRTAENLTAVNLLYAVCVLVMPYPGFLVAMLRMGVLLQLVNAGYLLFRMARGSSSRDSCSMASALVMTVANLVYWYRLSTGNLKDSFVVLIAGALVYGVSETVLPQIVRGWKRAKGHIGTEKEYVSGGATIAAEGNTEVRDSASRIIYTELRSSTRAFEAVCRIVDGKGLGVNGHGLHVAEYTRVICHAMGMGQERAGMIADAALLHDIGKTAVPQSLLNKKKLTDSEFELIRNHTVYGYHFLRDDDDPFAVLAADIAREHHERVDGSGYMGLKGDEICLAARIVSVADVFDALTSDRIYKKTWSFESGFQYILEHSGTYFDADVAAAFCQARERIRAIYDIYQRREHSGEGTNYERRNDTWIS